MLSLNWAVSAALLQVPLVKDGAVVGFIAIFRREPGVFPETQVALLEASPPKRSSQWKTRGFLTEQQEALEQQTATAEVLQMINASPGDLKPVFDTMLEKAMRLCGGTIGGIFTFDGDHSVTSAVRGVTAAFEQYNNKYPMDKIQPGTLPARIIETRGPVQYADVTAGEPYRAGHPYARALVELGGIRAALAVPFLKDGVAVGMVAIYRQEVGAFSDKQIVLLQNFAAQAVIAMENARLLTEQREALEQQTATAEVLQVINASPGNLAPVFDAVLEKAMRLCGAAFGSLYTYDGERFLAAANAVCPGICGVQSTAPTDAGTRRRHRCAGRDEKSRACPRLATHEHYRAAHPGVRAMVDLAGVRTSLWSLAQGRCSAWLHFDLSPGGAAVLRQADRAVGSFAAQAVIAMENARLLDEQREALEQQTATAEVLGIINSNPGDLTPVFDTMLEKAHGLCGIAMGSLELYDRQRFRAVAVRGLSDVFADMLRQGYPASENPATRPLIDGDRPNPYS